MTIETKKFLNTLQNVKKLTYSDNGFPILNNVLFKDNTIYYTNLDQDYSETITDNKFISCTVNINDLLEYVKTIKDKSLDYDFKDNCFILSHGNQTKYFDTLPVDDYPMNTNETAINETFFIDNNLFTTMKSLKPLMLNDCKDYNDYALYGVCINNNQYIATNKTSLKIVTNDISNNRKSRCDTIPYKLVCLLAYLKTDTDIKIAISDTQILINYDNITITSKIIDCVYPSYETILTDLSFYTIKTYNRLDLLKAIRADDNETFAITFNDNKYIFNKSNIKKVLNSINTVTIDIYFDKWHDTNNKKTLIIKSANSMTYTIPN